MVFLQNILTSNYDFNNYENLSKFRFILLNTLLIIATFFAFINLGMSYSNLIKLPDLYEKVLLTYTILNIFAFMVLRKSKDFYLSVVHFIIFNAYVLFIAALILSPEDSFRLIWFFILLLSSFVLVGKKYGLYFMFIITCTILIIYATFNLGYNALSISTFFNAFFVFTAFMYYFTNKIDKDELEFERLNQMLEQKVEKEVSLRMEKEVLLQEVHHRVKNNLHIILSIVRLQHNPNNQTQQTELLIDLENRINAIVKSYEMLIVNDNLQSIQMQSYLETMISDMKENFFHLNYEIEFDSNIDAQLPLKEAVYIGLISNEIITNSYKHAFPNKKGKITLSLLEKNNTYKLHIHDDGIGFIQKESSTSLGQKLIYTLATEQLKGTIEIQSVAETSYTIQFTL